MGRFLIEDVPSIENARLDPRRLSAMIVRLILSSREIESKVYDSNPRTGTFVVVLEGTLDVGQQQPESETEDVASFGALLRAGSDRHGS